MPNFLIIGAQKSGTTSLYNYLRQHPDIFMPAAKEAHFFTYLDGYPDMKGPGKPAVRIITRIEEYRAMFAAVGREKAVGEASPSYIYHPAVPERIRRHLTAPRLIAILRQPADRAYSNYLHASGYGREPKETFREALEEEDERIRRGWGFMWHYRSKGYYSGQIERYYETFGRASVKVCLFEDLISTPLDLVADLFRFLEVDPRFIPDASQKHNVSLIPRPGLLNRRLLNLRNTALSSFARRLLPRDVHRRFKRARFTRPPALEPELRNELSGSYANDILKLQDLIGRDLSHWLVSQ